MWNCVVCKHDEVFYYKYLQHRDSQVLKRIEGYLEGATKIYEISCCL